MGSGKVYDVQPRSGGSNTRSDVTTTQKTGSTESTTVRSRGNVSSTASPTPKLVPPAAKPTITAIPTTTTIMLTEDTLSLLAELLHAATPDITITNTGGNATALGGDSSNDGGMNINNGGNARGGNATGGKAIGSQRKVGDTTTVTQTMALPLTTASKGEPEAETKEQPKQKADDESGATDQQAPPSKALEKPAAVAIQFNGHLLHINHDGSQIGNVPKIDLADGRAEGVVLSLAQPFKTQNTGTTAVIKTGPEDSDTLLTFQTLDGHVIKEIKRDANGVITGLVAADGTTHEFKRTAEGDLYQLESTNSNGNKSVSRFYKAPNGFITTIKRFEGTQGGNLKLISTQEIPKAEQNAANDQKVLTIQLGSQAFSPTAATLISEVESDQPGVTTLYTTSTSERPALRVITSKP